jgi:tetratricopeptide (TPR) repeat protein
LGLLLFEAEEALARGQPDKALVVASRAVKERPDSLTARALVERSRRILLRGRRREHLERRVGEAEGLLQGGDLRAAERIVNSALKLVPDHTRALALFSRLRQQRLAAGTAEAEAEQELHRLAQERAGRALEGARRAALSGWERKALLSVRRGLSLVPDDPALLAFYRELESSSVQRDAARARVRAQLFQLRAGLDLLQQGRLDDSLRILRALLREDPDNVRAQSAIQQVRQAWLRARGGAVGAPAPAVAAKVAASPPAAKAAVPPPPIKAPAPPPTAPPKASPTPSRPLPPPAPPPVRPEPPRAATMASPGGAPPPAAAARRPFVSLPAPARGATPVAAPEVHRPVRRRRGRTPLVLVLGGAAAFAAVIGIVFMGRESPGDGRRSGESPSAPPGTQPTRSSPEREAILGPLIDLDPALQSAVEEALASYAHALESGDEARLARARPDLSSGDRQSRITPFVGVVDAHVDLRVLEVSVGGDTAAVKIERTDLVGQPQPRVATETLRFLNRNGEWFLR